ncbi:UDP-glucose 4-epimerase GalE [Armatimonas rosea]|uniref:UDP-glucose 4-epimerase n=1 Tax=Armatimonas rosea TaxID=685828 RepID=A0A7W9SNE9_ARMRO|nr:UDP-glucose 4-epimerase GalE [Armatimonas rosea]MBB6049842.1 UDP-glucose 4-epimerase [Armatimonas rosea]
MSILVVGGAGYIGSHTTLYLKESGHEVVILDNFELGHRKVTKILDVPFVYADYGDSAAVGKAIRQYKVDAVMHFGAYASVPDSVADPRKYYEGNIGKGLALLGAMLDNGVKNLIFSSSAATFGEPQILPIPEDHPQKTTNPYGETKLMFERILKDYEHAFGLTSVSLRYFNAAGADSQGRLGEDHSPEQHALPLLLDTALGRREKFFVYGTDWDTRDGSCMRDFIHVEDLADAHIRALSYLRDGGKTTAYNLGNTYGTTVLEALAAAEKVTGVTINWEAAPRRPGDPGRLCASCEKIKAELGWAPKYPDIESILKHAYEWRKSHPKGYYTESGD